MSRCIKHGFYNGENCPECANERHQKEQVVTDSAGSDANREALHWAESLVTPEMVALELAQDTDVADGERLIDERIWHGLIRTAARYQALEATECMACVSREIGAEVFGWSPDSEDCSLCNGHRVVYRLASTTNPQSGSGTTPSTLSSEPLQVGPNKEEFRDAFESWREAENPAGDLSRTEHYEYTNNYVEFAWRGWNACYRWLKGERK